MGNCLVTKLKASVDNDSLLKLGAIEVVNLHKESPTNSETYHKLEAPDSTLSQMYSITGGVKGPGFYCINGGSTGNGYNYDVVVLNDKYNYTYIQFGAGWKIKNIESLASCDKVQYLSLYDTIPDYILGELISLETLKNAQTTGDAEVVVEVARKKGGNSGRITRDWNLGGLKLGGWRIAVNNANCILEWDDSYVWVVEGDTKIYTNAATSLSRISEWQAEGKTVVVYNNGVIANTYNPTN